MYKLDLLPKDILIKLSIELDLPSIFEFITLNKRLNEIICKNDIFWMNKFHHDYSNYPKVSDLTWVEFYKYVTVTEPNYLLWKGVEENVLSYVVIGLKLGADIQSRKEIEHGTYLFPLSVSSEYGYLEIVKYLVEQGAMIRYEHDYAFKASSRNGHLEVVKYLLEQGANVRSDYNLSFLSASGNGHLEVVKYLVEQGASVGFRNNYALRLASRKGHLEIVKYLVEQGANVRARDDYALEWASKNEHLEVVKYLVGRGADVRVNDNWVLRNARENEHVEMVNYLESLP